MIKLINFSAQNKQNKKDTFFSNPKVWHFHDFLNLEFFPEKSPTQKLANSLGPRRNCQKNQAAFTDLYILTRNSQNFETEYKTTVGFETEYKTTVVDKTLVSNIPKIQTIP